MISRQNHIWLSHQLNMFQLYPYHSYNWQANDSIHCHYFTNISHQLHLMKTEAKCSFDLANILSICQIMWQSITGLAPDQYSRVFVDAMRYRSTPSPVPPMMPLVPRVDCSTEAEVGRDACSSAGSIRLRKYFFNSFVPRCTPKNTINITISTIRILY